MGVTPAFEKCQQPAVLYFLLLLQVTLDHQLLCTRYCLSRAAGVGGMQSTDYPESQHLSQKEQKKQ